MRHRSAGSLTALLVAASVTASAQSDSTRLDSSRVESPVPIGTDTTAGFTMTKSPVKAVLWGLIPGGGQVYTEQYWKVPMFVVPIGVLTALAIHFEGKRSDFAEEVAGLTPDSAGYSTAVINRNNNQDRRDLSIAVAGGVWILSLVDAYVGAHLYDFDVGDSLAVIRVYPDPTVAGVGIAVRW